MVAHQPTAARAGRACESPGRGRRVNHTMIAAVTPRSPVANGGRRVGRKSRAPARCSDQDESARALPRELGPGWTGGHPDTQRPPRQSGPTTRDGGRRVHASGAPAGTTGPGRTRIERGPRVSPKRSPPFIPVGRPPLLVRPATGATEISRTAGDGSPWSRYAGGPSRCLTGRGVSKPSVPSNSAAPVSRAATDGRSSARSTSPGGGTPCSLHPHRWGAAAR